MYMATLPGFVCWHLLDLLRKDTRVRSRSTDLFKRVPRNQEIQFSYIQYKKSKDLMYMNKLKRPCLFSYFQAATISHFLL